MIFGDSQEYEQSWADFAAAEVGRKGAIPRHMSPRAVQAFFEELLPAPEEEQEENEDEDLMAECNHTAELEENQAAAATTAVVDNLEPITAAAATPTTTDATPMTANTTTTQPKKLQCSAAQLEHFQQYPRMIDEGLCEEFFKDWRNVLLQKPTIGPRRKKVLVSDYYVRSSAVWLPHIIIDNYVPCCPHCKTNSRVDTSRAKWVEFPMLCYSKPLCKYLDTCRYPCMGCKKSFRGTNLDLMALDESGQVRALFRFHILRRCAVDEVLFLDIFLDIVKRPLDSTNSIFVHLRAQGAQKYISDVIKFLVNVKSDNIARATNSITDHFTPANVTDESTTASFPSRKAK
jgi:hypothetical protein